MLEVIHDDNKNIIAVCEWWLVDKEGNFDKNGEFIWVAEVEINPLERNKGILKEFIKRLAKKVPQAKFGYFWRLKKYPYRQVRMYSRNKWLSLIKEE